MSWWSRLPKRPLNYCSSCGHSWFPRGHDLARKCPACGSDLVDGPASNEPASDPWVLPVLLLVLLGPVLLVVLAWSFCLIPRSR